DRPSLVLKTPPAVATSSPINSVVGSPSSSSASAALTASRYVISTLAPSSSPGTASACVDICLDLLKGRVGRLRRLLGARVDRGLDLLAQHTLRGGGQDPLGV